MVPDPVGDVMLIEALLTKLPGPECPIVFLG